MTGCVDCHTMQGKEEGDWVNLEQAMHRSGAEASCVGCHEQKQTDKTCAGCHGFMTRTRQMPQTYCNTCHSAPLVEGETVEPAEAQASAAMEALATRTQTLGTYDVADIPETVTIKILSEAYEPVSLPHRKIVTTLAKGIEGNELVKYFHTEQGTLCQGCHHNSPAAKKPPQCASCHGKPFQDSDMFRPGLMAAYHQQCMGCHDEMEIEKPASRDCAGCHKEK
jgi:DnaJ-class molecular chaperone